MLSGSAGLLIKRAWMLADWVRCARRTYARKRQVAAGETCVRHDPAPLPGLHFACRPDQPVPTTARRWLRW